MFNYIVRYNMVHKRVSLSVWMTIFILSFSISMVALINLTFKGTEYDDHLSQSGAYNYVLPYLNEEQLESLKRFDEFEKVGAMYLCSSLSETGGNDFNVYYMDEQCRDLYHIKMKSGTFPNNKSELALSESMLKLLGASLNVGDKINVYENGEIKRCKISGIISDFERSLSENDLSLAYPQAFIGEKNDNSKIEMGFVAEKTNADRTIVDKRFKSVGLPYEQLDHLAFARCFYLNTSEINMDFDEEASYEKGFESSILIPLFSLIVGIISIITMVYALANYLSNLRKNIALCELLGVSERHALLAILSNVSVMVIIMAMFGILSSILLYYLFYQVLVNIVGIKMVSAFAVDEIIKVLCMNPVIYPFVVTLECAFLSLAITLLKHRGIKPLELVNNRKIESRGTVLHKKNKFKALLNSGISYKFVCIVTLALTIAFSYFSSVYLKHNYDMAKDDIEQTYKEKNMAGYDIFAIKDYSIGNISMYNENRHNTGFDEQNIKKLDKFQEIERLDYSIEIPSAKVINTNKNANAHLQDFSVLAGFPDNLKELNEKSWIAKGYSKEEYTHMLNIPLALTNKFDDDSKALTESIVEGTFNKEKFESGEEIIILKDSAEAFCPYKVGDEVKFTDTYIEDEQIDNFNFSTGAIPKEAEASFQYEYEGRMIDAYSFGERTDCTVKVGAIAVLNSDQLRFYKVNSLSIEGENEISFLGSLGVKNSWKINDKKYTKIGIVNKKSSKAFERYWNKIVRENGDIVEEAAKTIKKEMLVTKYKYVISFLVVLIVVMISAIWSLHSLIRMGIAKKREKIALMRILGFEKKQIIKTFLIQFVICMVIAIFVAWVPFWGYTKLCNYGNEYLNQNSNVHTYTDSETGVNVITTGPKEEDNQREKSPFESVFRTIITFNVDKKNLVLLYVLIVLCVVFPFVMMLIAEGLHYNKTLIEQVEQQE